MTLVIFKMKNKQLTLWDKIKNDNHYYYGGDGGYEVQWKHTTYFDHAKKRDVTKAEFIWPYNGPSRESKIPRGEVSKIKTDVKLAHRMRKLLAQASANETEYDELRKRISGVPYEKIFELGLTGGNLRSYLRYHHLTDGEAHSLFYRM